MSKKIKGLLALGDITPRTKSNLFETFVSNRYSIFFSSKTAKKPSEHGWLFLHSMSLKHPLLRYNTFTLLHQTLIKKEFNKRKLSRTSPKNKQKILPWKLQHPKTCSKWRTWGVRNRNVKKIKGLLALGDFTPRTKSNLLETFVSNRY